MRRVKKNWSEQRAVELKVLPVLCFHWRRGQGSTIMTSPMMIRLGFEKIAPYFLSPRPNPETLIKNEYTTCKKVNLGCI
jgi:hypothetical protein